MKQFVIALFVLCLSACSAPEEYVPIPVQNWDGTLIEIQTRPAPVSAGMNEFLVIATLERGKPVHDLIVSLRASDAQEWKQAIQDGHSGVYRKAVMVPKGARYIYVDLRKKRSEDATELKFDLYPER